MYNEKVLDHFNNPRNVGESERKDGVGQMQSPACGDTTFIYLDVEEGLIKDIKFKTFGCAAAIASSSVLTEMAKGLTLEEAKKITNAQLVDALGGLPELKIHCSVLAADALHAAIADYESKHQA
ncbi:MAG: iron-sulfur cluster assembly scaffold protein [Firmicutes bacterium]|nr:iron-sulfur cluster assembly scaffold protein [Bacillota bacterium]